MLTLEQPKAQKNNRQRPGTRASKSIIWGGETGSRYCCRAYHTRFEQVQWFVTDVEQPDGYGMASIIRQNDSFEKAVEGLE